MPMSAVDQDKISDYIRQIRELREKQLSGTTLTDEELKQGMSLLAKVRTVRAGKTIAPDNAAQSLSDMF